MKDRVIRDGRVAVVYSPGFGAGWSTWAHGEHGNELVFSESIEVREELNWIIT